MANALDSKTLVVDGSGPGAPSGGVQVPVSAAVAGTPSPVAEAPARASTENEIHELKKECQTLRKSRAELITAQEAAVKAAEEANAKKLAEQGQFQQLFTTEQARHTETRTRATRSIAEREVKLLALTMGMPAEFIDVVQLPFDAVTVGDDFTVNAEKAAERLAPIIAKFRALKDAQAAAAAQAAAVAATVPGAPIAVAPKQPIIIGEHGGAKPQQVIGQQRKVSVSDQYQQQMRDTLSHSAK
jgi:hypothetical protein